jgi:hypothetical protein
LLYICFLGSFEIFKESHVEVKESLEEMLSRLKNVTQIEHNNIIYQQTPESKKTWILDVVLDF